MTYLSVFPRQTVAADNPLVRRMIEKTIIGSLAPRVPPLRPGGHVTSIGSCFANEIALLLERRGFQSLIIPVTETMNSAFALDMCLAHHIDGVDLPDGFRVDHKHGGIGTGLFVETLAKAETVVMTFGMSLIWCDGEGRPVNEPPHSNINALPATSLQKLPARYVMRQTTVAENVDLILSCIARVRRICAAPIVLTLSPVPLMGTRCDVPAVTANALSKSTLRVALGEVMARGLSDVYYWPSYEIVTWFGNHVERAFGEEGRDARHVRRKVVDVIGDLFVSHYVRS